ncbi:MAG: lipoate--protein ligase family protein [Isosphaera sp.]|nr:lipoate--protein ligase family protein [Isosphaera sp.]
MTPRLRLLPLAAADGPTNMAADEALLGAADRGAASFRFYTWSEPTLSLGYFQPSAGRDHPPLAALPWVRRPTGGAGIVHHHELTYCFALPAEAARASADSWVCRFHRLVRAALADRGVASRLVVCGEEQKLGDVLCFLHHTPGDLAVGGSKIAGSAQRKFRGALLQHGSILLRRSLSAPELPGVCDLAGTDVVTAEELAADLGPRFAADLGAALESDDWTADELARIPTIRTEKYANPAWNDRR